MIFEKHNIGEQKNAAYFALCAMMRDFDVGISYADMMRLRISGAVYGECHDVYYIAHEDGVGIGRHWNGWGKHADSIGNWGNFFVNGEHRGKGIGGKLLDLWWKDFHACEDRPLCFLCATGNKELATKVYSRFGFVPAMEGADHGPLYMPIGNAPSSFREFYRSYYKPSGRIVHKRATVEYRHEIDCLLRFAFMDLGNPFGIGDIKSIESALLYYPERAGILFSDDGHVVGWSFDKKMQVHPLYSHSVIENFNDFAFYV